MPERVCYINSVDNTFRIRLLLIMHHLRAAACVVITRLTVIHHTHTYELACTLTLHIHLITHTWLIHTVSIVDSECLLLLMVVG